MLPQKRVCAKRVFLRKGAYGNMLMGEIGGIDDVKDEVMVGNYRVDIAFMSCGIPEFAIEIVHTHKVPTEKSDDFAKWKFPFIEVESQHVIEQWESSLKDMPSTRALRLKPTRHNFHIKGIREQRSRYDCQHCSPELFTKM